MGDSNLRSFLQEGARYLYSGGVATVPAGLAERFQGGDRLIILQHNGELLYIPRQQGELADEAVRRAGQAFKQLALVPESAIDTFYREFAQRLGDDAVWGAVAAANAADVARAVARGRSTTRLRADDKMRRSMVAGVEEWAAVGGLRNRVSETIRHQGWTVEQVISGLGVVGFIFEGRPNVFADATGVLRSGNTSVLRIGSDALGTARAIMEKALLPALEAAQLPRDSVVLLESAEHSAGWALFANPSLALAVARGSGRAVEQLGAVARQAGVPVSLHGTGGAWMVASPSADPERLRLAIHHSLDRKVCNTLNTLCLVGEKHVALALSALGQRGSYKLHVAEDSRPYLPAEMFRTPVTVLRATGPVQEMQAEVLDRDGLGREWEWEGTPEVSLCVVADLEEAVSLFNRYSPQFVASLVSQDPEEQERFFQTVNAPFVGDGFTRWVDGQYALSRPELGLSNWQSGRLFARGGILSGDGVYTVRLRVRQTDPGVHR